MKIYTLIITSLLISLFVSAQVDINIGYLQENLKHAPDSLKADILLDLCWEYRNSDPEKAIDYGIQAIQFATDHNDYQNLAKAHGFIGVGYRIMGNYSEALDYYYQGLEIAQQYNELEQEGYAYINIGNLNIYQEYYSNAVDNLSKATEIASKIHNMRMVAYANLNLGRAQLLRKEYNEAIEHLSIALEIREATENFAGQAVVYKDLGDVYFEMKDYEKALKNYKESSLTINKNSDHDLYANVNVKIAQVHYELGDYKQAKQYAEKGLKLAGEVGSKLFIKNAVTVLAEISFLSHDYKKAAQYKDLIIRYNDTLFNQQLAEKIFNYEYQIEKDKKEAEIDLLNKEQRIQELTIRRTRFTILALAIILLLTTAFLVFALYSARERRKQNNILRQQKEELKEINAMKDKMFLIIGHDLRGPISNLESLIEVLIEENQMCGNSELADIFKVFMDSVHSVYNLLENLLYWANSRRGEVLFSPEKVNLNGIINENIQLYASMASSKHLTISSNIEGTFNVTADKNMLKTILRNLLSNSIKYTPEQGSINVDVEKIDKYIEVSVSDNGVGFNNATYKKMFDDEVFFTTHGTKNEMGSGLGLIICKEFIEAHGGILTAESKEGQGSKFTFTIPAI